MGNRFEALRLPNRFTRRTLLGVVGTAVLPILAACQPQESDQDVAATTIALVEYLGAADAPAETPKRFQTPEKITAILVSPTEILDKKPTIQALQKKVEPQQAAPTKAKDETSNPQATTEAKKTSQRQPITTPRPEEYKEELTLIRSGSFGIPYEALYPARTWTVKIGAGDIKTIDLFRGPYIDGFQVQIWVTAVDIDPRMTAEAYARNIFELQKKYFQEGNPEKKDPEKERFIVLSKFGTVDGQEAWTVTESYPKGIYNNDHNYPFKRTKVVFIKKGHVWEIGLRGYAAPEYDAQLSIFHKMLDSFKVL